MDQIICVRYATKPRCLLVIKFRENRFAGVATKIVSKMNIWIISKPSGPKLLFFERGSDLMSLIKCPNCKNEISNLAENCPVCETRFKTKLTPIKEDIAFGIRIIKFGLYCLFIIVLSISLAIFISYLQSK